MRRLSYGFALLGLLSLGTSALAQGRSCDGLQGLDGSCTREAAVNHTSRISRIVATSHVAWIGSPISPFGPRRYNVERLTRGLALATVQASTVQQTGPVAAGPKVGTLRPCGNMTCFRGR